MKVHFLPVTLFQEAKLAGRIDPHNGRRGRTLVLFDLTLHAADLILKLPTSMLEGVVNCKCKVGVPLVRGRGSCDVDLPPIGKDKAYMNFV